MPREIMWANHCYSDCPLIRKEYDEAERRYAKAIVAALNLGDVFQASGELAGLASAICGQNRFEKSIQLFGAMRAKLDDLAAHQFATCFQVILDEYLDKARQRMGEEKSTILFNQGKQMGFDKAVEYALDFDKD
jgi:hypothetical protein